MADNDAERTEQPTQKRLDEARKNGQIPRSTELNAAAVVLIAGGGLHFLGRGLGSDLFNLMRGGLTISRTRAAPAERRRRTSKSRSTHRAPACARS